MTVTVKLIGGHAHAAGFHERTVALAVHTTVGELLDRVGVKQSLPSIVTRNGRAVALADVLADGDRLVVAPIYSGG
jgi:molybdopterin converting factor small subunit